MTYQETARFLLERDNYLILTHSRPDGDTTGSASALCRSLKQAGKRAFLLYDPDILAYCEPCTDGLYVEDGFIPETIVAVDIADTILLPKCAEGYKDRVDLCIDHHPSNRGYAKNLCLYPDAAAAGEVIYHIIQAMELQIGEDIALPLYIAIATDTGCFRFQSTSPDTHRIAAALMETGIDTGYLNARIFGSKSLSRLRLEGEMISSLELIRGGHAAICTLTLEQIKRAGATVTDIDGIASYPKDIEGVDAGITIRQTDEGYKVSVRTSPKVDACLVCSQLGGGGHARASGCTMKGDITQVKNAVLDALIRTHPDV